MSGSKPMYLAWMELGAAMADLGVAFREVYLPLARLLGLGPLWEEDLARRRAEAQERHTLAAAEAEMLRRGMEKQP